MTTALDVLNVARSQLGTHESPAGSNRQSYGAELGQNGVPWCSIFVRWVLRHAGLDLPISASADAAMRWWRGQGLLVEHPAPGDVVYYHFPHEHAGANHTGFVESVHPSGAIVAIEGNTGAGSDTNGGAVMRRTRARSLCIAFARPPYATSQPASHSEDDDMPQALRLVKEAENTTHQWLIGPGIAYHVPNTEQLGQLEHLYGKAVDTIALVVIKAHGKPGVTA